MGQEKGTLARWNNEKGYGFIHSHLGNKEIYFHIKSLPPYQRRPKIGDILAYHLEMDERGRFYASSAKITGLAWSQFTFIWAFLVLVFGAYVCLVFQQTLGFHSIAIYAAMSLLTIWAYISDKRSAQLGKRRTNELKLHILEALGGWPGALLAQVFYRHKLQKVSYQIVFWLIVMGHGILWYHVLTHQEQYRPYQQIVAEKIQILINNAKTETNRLLTEENAKTLSGARKQTESTEQRTNRIPSGCSMVPPLEGMRIVQGVVKEIRQREGVVVTLDQGSEGMINKSNLVRDFSRCFKQGDRIRVAVQEIAFEGNQSRIRLLLVE
jgi:uncharacterized membrane protein YsdA (DUF1294 family)/cold shock CspA family protein